ncbi:MAG: succinate dehydrogenase, cytochrome b556 subunit [Gammaproteobacteria bacterium]|nr:succinate dehydrogenase, cytochrome b556 subunit [Gammaproteobacteria bacterium]MDE0251803.1 succinate dehydrogenase, cytochrome b556 subunit [Gammaproteobacteria bacterium]MDE0403188.1 succinate dehydrogenase, cytochrome b556 subunit [Gammaproteobacteria bacterium]
MKDSRPVFLNLLKVELPLAALVSILHRISGVLLFFVAGLFLWILANSIQSEQSFHSIKQMFREPVYAVILWISLSLVGYHFIAGIRHLLMDLHIGDSLRAGKVSALIALILSILVSLLLAGWIWL